MRFLIVLLSLTALAVAKPPAPTFTEEREIYKTKLRREGPSPQQFERVKPPDGVTQIEYKSGELKLAAWVTRDPGDGKTHPAVVYVHGGFAFGMEDWEETKPYRDAGFVVMTPMLRGENGNPGNWELFYGEVDDVIAAGKHAASLPYVDARRVFVAGHSSGATDVILASLVSPNPFAAAAPIGGFVTIEDFARNPQWRESLTFDPDDAREVRLRSAINFPASIFCPITFYVGEGDLAAQRRLAEFIAKAKAKDASVSMVKLPGDHHSSNPEALRRSADLFKQISQGR